MVAVCDVLVVDHLSTGTIYGEDITGRRQHVVSHHWQAEGALDICLKLVAAQLLIQDACATGTPVQSTSGCAWSSEHTSQQCLVGAHAGLATCTDRVPWLPRGCWGERVSAAP